MQCIIFPARHLGQYANEFIVSCSKNVLNGVSSANLKSQQGHEYEVFPQNNIMHFILKCLKFYKYILYTSQQCCK